MNAHPDHLHEELERLRQGAHQRRQGQQSPLGSAPEVHQLAALAQALQAAAPLQVDPAFAARLERRLLARQARLQRQAPAAPRWGGSFVPRRLRAHPALAGVLSLGLVVVLLGTGLLVAAAQVTNPTNPLYPLKHWEQQVQVSLAGSPAAQAALELQTARDRLQVLPSLAEAPQAGPYRQALAAFDQQRRQAAQAIAALPAGPDHDRLVGELDTLQAAARQTLRGLLLHLAVPERQVTTEELGALGETVPQLTQVELTLPAHPNGQARVSISGTNLQAGARLLVDGRPVAASGALQQGAYLFTLVWKGEQHPHSLGLMNPDGMVAQTSAITVQQASDSPGNGNGSGSGKPGSTPTPPGNSGNKPTSTPTPPPRT